METESDNATQRRNDEFKTTARAAPQYGAAIVGNRLASLQCDSGHHRQAQRGRRQHGATLAGKPAAAPGFQGQASLIGRIGQPSLARRGCPSGHDRSKLLRYRRRHCKDSNADALAGASTRANIAMKRNIHIGAENDSTYPREHLESRHRHGR
jgi:hypothetical protein